MLEAKYFQKPRLSFAHVSSGAGATRSLASTVQASRKSTSLRPWRFQDLCLAGANVANVQRVQMGSLKRNMSPVLQPRGLEKGNARRRALKSILKDLATSIKYLLPLGVVPSHSSMHAQYLDNTLGITGHVLHKHRDYLLFFVVF